MSPIGGSLILPQQAGVCGQAGERTQAGNQTSRIDATKLYCNSEKKIKKKFL